MADYTRALAYGVAEAVAEALNNAFDNGDWAQDGQLCTMTGNRLCESTNAVIAQDLKGCVAELNDADAGDIERAVNEWRLIHGL